MMSSQKVYEAIAAVTAELAKEGIAKGRRNQQQGYSFRGIDEVYNALSPIIARHKLCILPRILSRDVTERTTQKGGVLFYVVVEAEFDFVSAEDGSRHTVRTFGEAMDSADKATNKAMSAAYKYAAMQAFCIPTEGDNDADATTHEVAPRGSTNAGSKPSENPFEESPSDEQRLAYIQMAESVIDEAPNQEALRDWWAGEKQHRVTNGLTKQDIDKLVSRIKAKPAAASKEAA